jgi:hypothetical protein
MSKAKDARQKIAAADEWLARQALADSHERVNRSLENMVAARARGAFIRTVDEWMREPMEELDGDWSIVEHCPCHPDCAVPRDIDGFCQSIGQGPNDADAWEYQRSMGIPVPVLPEVTRHELAYDIQGREVTFTIIDDPVTA